MTWPSRVTILNRLRYCRAMAMALSSSSTMTVRPRRFSTIPRYRSSQRTRREATPTKPRQLSTPDSCRERGEMALRGRKVARPPPVRFKNPMAALASDSVSTTICCMAAPRAISMAVVNRSSV
ncbi:unknown [Firmicutes bacterium CAG:137]|nr:unknown [Firmicutes bacterium CAG:137]